MSTGYSRKFRQIKIIRNTLLVGGLEEDLNDLLYETEHEVILVDIRWEGDKKMHVAIIHLLCTEEPSKD